LKRVTIAIAWRYSPQVHSASHSKLASIATEVPVISHAAVRISKVGFPALIILFGTFSVRPLIPFTLPSLCNTCDAPLRAHIKAIDLRISFLFPAFSKTLYHSTFP
jgi:hypothetical protein